MFSSSRNLGYALEDAPDAQPATGWTLLDLRSKAEPATAEPAANAEQEREARTRDLEREAMEREAAERAAREAELEAVRAAAYAAGAEAGAAEATARERERLAHAVQALTGASEAFTAQAADWTHALEANVAALSVAVARHIVGREIRTDATAVADLVRRALTEFGIDEPVKVRLNPRDLSLLSAPAPGGAGGLDLGHDVSWVADADVLPGGCVAEGPHHVIDGRLDRALERVYRRLAGIENG